MRGPITVGPVSTPVDDPGGAFGSAGIARRLAVHPSMGASGRMIETTRADVADRVTSPPFTDIAGKGLVLSGDDSRETLAHCRILIDALEPLAGEVVVVGRYAGGDE